MTSSEKLDRVFDFLRTEIHWSLGEFLISLSETTDNKNARRRSAFEDAAYNTPEVLDRFLSLRSAKPATRLTVLNALEWGRPELRSEVIELGNTALFGRYNPDLATDFRDFQPHTILDKVQETAPSMLQTLKYIANAYKRGEVRENEYGMRLVMIMAILCFTQSRESCSNLPTNLGLHFLARGIKVREIDLLAQFGISVSYKSVQRALKSQADREAIVVTSAGSAEGCVTVYDNFEQVEGVKSQRVGDNSTFYSVTTGEVLRGLDIPPGGLRQNMLDTTVQLGIDEALLTLGNRNDEMESEVS